MIEHASKLGKCRIAIIVDFNGATFLKDLKSMCALEDIIEEYEKFVPKPFASSFEVVQLDVMYADALKEPIDKMAKFRANENLEHCSQDDAIFVRASNVCLYQRLV